MKRFILLLAALAVFGLPGTSFAQGNTAGIIRGTVKDQQGLPVPNVKITVTSAALQGPRSTTTDGQGLFVMRPLPPGDYHLTFELNGFTTVALDANLPLGLTLVQDVTMTAGAVAEQVEVVSQTPPPIVTPVVGMNFRQDQIEVLANRRTLQGIAQLAPATTTNGPNATQVIINGAFAFDNVFMINGVDVNDNLFASPQNLFIEDAIEETQVLTSGISAEFGRFGGGVINAITKSGSNVFSGSGRVNFANPSWVTATPFEVSKGQATVDAAHASILSKSYEGTFGGPVVRDRLWFFTSGRYSAATTPVTLPVTGLVVSQDDTNKRGELKLTGTVANGHTIQGGFVNDPRNLTNTSGLPNSFLIDPHDVVNENQPNYYYYTNYRGALKNNLLIEVQYSQRHFEFNQTGPSGSNIITDSPILNLAQNANYNAPYFDTNDPEARNNKQLTGNVTNYWNLAGKHETKGGYEWYRSQRTGGNSQSPTSYVFLADFVTDAAGNPVLDPATNKPIPNFVPGVSEVQFYPAVKGAVINIDNHSLFLQDHWTINGRWSADLGARFEHVKAASTGGIVSIDSNRIVPRLAVAYDLKGNGNHVMHATYGQYAGRYNEAQIGKNSPVGNPVEIDSFYQGPAGQGYNCAACFNPVNYPITAANVSFIGDPTQNVFMAPGTKSPLTHEVTLSYGENLFNGRGYAEVAYVGRWTHDLIEDFQTIQGGFTNVAVSGVSAGLFTNQIFEDTNQANRQYQGMVFQSRYRLSSNWTVNGHYTLQLKNYGNYEGEAASQPGQTSVLGNYPEALNAARDFPEGNLQDFQRSRLRLWSVYTFKVAGGDLSVSGLWRVDSARVFSLAARNQPFSQAQLNIIAAAGYPDAAATQNVFFGDRGSETFAGYGVLDTSINYNIPVFKSLRPWIKLDIYNLFNDEKLIAWNTTISQNTAAGVDNLGLATTFKQGATFGTATGNTQTNLLLNNINTFPLAFNGAATPGGRTFLVAVGFRF